MITAHTYQSSSSRSRTGKSPISRALGRTKVAYLSCASKYFTPLTFPSLFPYGSSRTTPTQKPAPKSTTLPTKATAPLAPLSILHREPRLIVLANSHIQSGSRCPVATACFCSNNLGLFFIWFCFHFLKFSGRLLQSSSLITYFSTPSKLSISLWMDAGFRSITYRTIPVAAPQEPSVLISSFISAMRTPLGSFSCKRVKETTDPNRIQMFSLTERID